MRATIGIFLALMMGPGSSAIASGAAGRVPPASLNLALDAPIHTWDEALPLGNGLLGGLLWGEGNRIRLSLDRGDLWDLRTPPEIREPGFTYANLQTLVREKNLKEINRLFEAPYNRPAPTKIPAGRLEIVLDSRQRASRFELDLAAAEGRVWLEDSRKIGAFFSADRPVALIRIPGRSPEEIVLRKPGSGTESTGPDSHPVSDLGYPPATEGRSDEARWFLQPTAGDLKFCVYAGWRRSARETLLAVTVSSTVDGPDPLELARRNVREALTAGYQALFRPHMEWWADFWSRSSISLPERDILRQYYLVRYFYGASSRLGTPPMPLQGVWTADAGSLPPWKGDYHNDLNTQMSYMGYQASGHVDEGRCFLDFNWKLLPSYRRFAREFFQTPGANVPGVMSLAGDPLTGWPQYSLSPTMSAWIGHLFYLHWRYTADEDFLRTRAYPWCREIGWSLRALLQKSADGRLRLPLSSSPEVFDNSLRAWLRPNSNYDLFSLRMLFLCLTEMAETCGESAEAREWRELAGGLGEYHTKPDGTLLLDSQEELAASHRHLSNLMGLYPFNLLTIEGSIRERQILQASLGQWDRLGTSAWCGYSFTWMAALRARTGEAETALRNLDIFVKAFTLRNGFHANGDQTRSGFSSFTYRPFTLEGNMLAAAAVHEMMLQSWNPVPGTLNGEVLRIFPAMPWRWHQASFENLRAEGGWRVSARRENNATTWVRVVAGRGGVVRIRDNFGERRPAWSRAGVRKIGDNYEVALEKGAVIEASLPRPSNIPPMPANAAWPVVIGKASTGRP